MIVYTLIYVELHGRIVMVRGRNHDWRHGKLNFPGGKVEVGEPVADAAHRELLEETGLVGKLSYVGIVNGEDFFIYVFRATRVKNSQQGPSSDEEVVLADIDDVLAQRELLVSPNVALMTALIRGGLPGWAIKHNGEDIIVQPIANRKSEVII